MTDTSLHSIEQYSYTLPYNRIAKYPLSRRDVSKLLIYKNKDITESTFNLISAYLPENSLLFYNNTKVIHARLIFQRVTGALIEIFCLSPCDPPDYQLAFSSLQSCTWKCLVGNLKKWKSEPIVLLPKPGKVNYTLQAEKVQIEDNSVWVKFTWKEPVPFGQIVEAAGSIPIPPYLNRKAETIDNERYQTVYSKPEGSVAAPTAGLHFTPDVLETIKERDITLHELTLHVGAGTFQPVKSKNLLEHAMHHEFFSITIATLRQLAFHDKPLTATGTTTIRALESLYWLAVKSVMNKKTEHLLNQWEPYTLKPDITFRNALSGLISLMEKENMDIFHAHTGLMIVPGYMFRSACALITNFHQPQSTLLLLVAAYVGDDWRKIYRYALENNFRFLSYGDSSLLFQNNSDC